MSKKSAQKKGSIIFTPIGKKALWEIRGKIGSRVERRSNKRGKGLNAETILYKAKRISGKGRFREEEKKDGTKGGRETVPSIPGAEERSARDDRQKQ